MPKIECHRMRGGIKCKDGVYHLEFTSWIFKIF